MRRWVHASIRPQGRHHVHVTAPPATHTLTHLCPHGCQRVPCPTRQQADCGPPCSSQECAVHAQPCGHDVDLDCTVRRLLLQLLRGLGALETLVGGGGGF